MTPWHRVAATIIDPLCTAVRMNRTRTDV